VPLDERFQIDRIKRVTSRIGQSGNIARRDSLRHPPGELTASLGLSCSTVAIGDLLESTQRLARERLQHTITNAEEAVPGDRIRFDETLLNFGEGNRSKIEHRLRGEQLEVRGCLVGACNDLVDLIRFSHQ
jgi:hypothetical protein